MKRFLDIVVSAAALLVLWPVILVIAIQVRRKLGSPVFFRQTRPGLHGEPFEIVKFRTMRAARPGEDEVETDAERLTDFGRLLRRTSLDEIPELWNVLKGDMSLVGPRPLMMSYLEKYTPEHMRRHDVRPGITGLAQVRGRQDLMFSQRMDLDVWYVQHWNHWLDLKILFETALQVIRRTGVRPGQDVRDVDDLGFSHASTREEG